MSFAKLRNFSRFSACADDGFFICFSIYIRVRAVAPDEYDIDLRLLSLKFSFYVNSHVSDQK